MRRDFAFLVVACTLAFATPARAQNNVGDVSVFLDSPWPATVSRGYFPMWFTLQNELDEPCSVEIDVDGRGYRSARRRVRTKVRLEAGEERTIEMYAPGFLQMSHYGGSGYGVQVAARGSRTWMGMTTSSGAPPGILHMLVATPSKLPAGAPDAIAERMSKSKALQAFSPIAVPTSGTRVRRGTTITTSSAPATAITVPTTVVDFEHLPTRYHGYTSLDLVVLDARRGLPPHERLEPLLAWTRLGGKLVVLAEDIDSMREELGGEDGWLEPRFRTVAGDDAQYTVGFGRLLLSQLGAQDPILNEASDIEAAAVQLVRGARNGWIPDAAGWRFGGGQLLIPGLAKLPMRTFLILLLLFAVVIGPLNMMMVKRLARPALLLVTIPAISLVSSVGILAYGILYQGIDIKSVSHSLTILDQRTHRAATIERRTMFVGLSPGAGLRPAAGTAVFPNKVTEDTEVYEIDFEKGALLRGTYMAVRDPVQQTLLNEGSARARVELALDGEKLEVQNTFETSIEWLAVRAPDGRLFHTSDAIGAGESATLCPAPDEASLGTVQNLINDMHSDLRLAPATYVARLGDDLFTDSCGLELNPQSDNHVVQGILPADAKEW
ncbi:MAG: hypothetical protein GY711_03230 [bacterium]|nr:hypothetical protein [bacterium]